jgi:hypothetical protein
MKKKILGFCFFIVLMLMVLPVVSSYPLVSPQQSSQVSAVETQSCTEPAAPTSFELTGYLLIHVSVYTPGEGLHPYDGANITIKGLFHQYNGKTDDKGDCLFQLHSRLFRPKLYFIKVTIPPEDWMHTKINSMYIQTGQIVYRDYLFVVL